jgi:thioredoxin 1
MGATDDISIVGYNQATHAMTPQGNPTHPAANRSRTTQSRVPWRFIVVITVLAAGVALISYARNNSSHDRVAWRYSYNQANIEATDSDKPLLVYFTADWCGPCKQMKAWVYSDPAIAGSIEEGFVPVKVDLTSDGLPDQHLAERYGVQAIPTLLTLTSKGIPISMSSGYLTKEEFMNWLDNATERYVELKNTDTNDSATAFVEEPQER